MILTNHPKRATGRKRTAVSLLIVAIAICALTLILPAPAECRPILITFDGYVYYSEGVTPVPGTMIIVRYPASSPDYISVTTNATGYYSCTFDENGSDVNYTVTYGGVDYFAGPFSFTIPPERVTRNIGIPVSAPTPTPMPGITLEGYVRKDDGTPATGALVHLSYGGHSQDVTVDSAGMYHVSSDYYGGIAESWVTFEGLDYARWSFTPDSGSTIPRDWTLAGTSSSTSTPTPTPIPAATPTATPEPASGVTATPAATGAGTNATVTPSPEPATGTTATPVDGGSNSPAGCCGTTLIFLLASVLCPVLVLVKGRMNR